MKHNARKLRAIPKIMRRVLLHLQKRESRFSEGNSDLNSSYPVNYFKRTCLLYPATEHHEYPRIDIFKAITLALIFALLSNLSKAQKVSIDELKNLTSSGKLPAQIKIRHSNNNLDLVQFHGRYFLAFRTAP